MIFMTDKEKIFFDFVDYALMTSKNVETERTAKGIRAFYELEKAKGNNPDPFLYSCYAGALFPGHDRKETLMMKLKEYAFEILT